MDCSTNFQSTGFIDSVLLSIFDPLGSCSMTGLLLIETFMSSNNILFTISDALCKTYCSLSSGNFVCFFFFQVA